MYHVRKLHSNETPFLSLTPFQGEVISSITFLLNLSDSNQNKGRLIMILCYGVNQEFHI